MKTNYVAKWKICLFLKVKKCKQKLKFFLDMKVESEPQQAAPSPNTEDVG